jgi:hypothetical protein
MFLPALNQAAAPPLSHQKSKDAMERKLEQGLVESMAGSDPVSVTQPPKAKHHEAED